MRGSSDAWAETGETVVKLKCRFRPRHRPADTCSPMNPTLQLYSVSRTHKSSNTIGILAKDSGHLESNHATVSLLLLLQICNGSLKTISGKMLCGDGWSGVFGAALCV